MHSTAFYVFIFATGLTILSFSLVSRRIKSYIAPPPLIVAIGVALGFLIGDALPQNALLAQLETLSWIAVGFGVMSITLRFRAPDIARLWKPGSLITIVAMLGMWVVSSLIVSLLFDAPPVIAAMLGAIVTPTDPVVASSIVTGPFAERNIPARVRDMLSFESGANDGLAFPLVLLTIYLQDRAGDAWSAWLLYVVLWQVIGAGLLAALAGWVAGKIFLAAEARRFVGKHGVMLAGFALTAAILGGMQAIDVDSIWAVFVAGLAFTITIAGDHRDAVSEIQERASYLTMAPTLLLFGMTLPWSIWAPYGWIAVVAIALLLVARRLPVIALLFAVLRQPEREANHSGGTFHAGRDFWFYGWFGPLGLSAVYYALTAYRETGDQSIWSIASLLIFGSIVVHGLTAAPFTRWYAGTDESPLAVKREGNPRVSSERMR